MYSFSKLCLATAFVTIFWCVPCSAGWWHRWHRHQATSGVMAVPSVGYSYAAPVQNYMYSVTPSLAYGTAPLASGLTMAAPVQVMAIAPTSSFTTGLTTVSGGAMQTLVPSGGQPASPATAQSAAEMQSMIEEAFDRKLREFDRRSDDRAAEQPAFLGDVRAILGLFRELRGFRDEFRCSSEEQRDGDAIEDLKTRVRDLERNVQELERRMSQGGVRANDAGPVGIEPSEHKDARYRVQPTLSLTSKKQSTTDGRRPAAEVPGERHTGAVLEAFDQLSKEAESTLARLRNLK